MIKWIISSILSFIEKNSGSLEKTADKVRPDSSRKDTKIKGIVKKVFLALLPFIILVAAGSGCVNIGEEKAARELCPQVASIYEMESREPLDKVLRVIWRTPNNYHLMKRLESSESKESILQYYGHGLQKDGWNYDNVTFSLNHSSNILNSVIYRWEKGEYYFEISSLMVDGTEFERTADGKLIYYINVCPKKLRT